MNRPFTLFILCIFILSCGNENTKQSSSTKVQTPPPPQQEYPSVPVDKIRSLWNDCDYIDYTFVNLPVSMNRQELNDIRHTLGQIQLTEQPNLINTNCSPLGNMVFYQKGEIALEANFYFTQGCHYFVFLENNQPKYANFMSETGVSFFKDIMGKFSKMQK